MEEKGYTDHNVVKSENDGGAQRPNDVRSSALMVHPTSGPAGVTCAAKHGACCLDGVDTPQAAVTLWFARTMGGRDQPVSALSPSQSELPSVPRNARVAPQPGHLALGSAYDRMINRASTKRL